MIHISCDIVAVDLHKTLLGLLVDIDIEQGKFLQVWPMPLQVYKTNQQFKTF